MKAERKRWDSRQWVGPVPYGIGQVRPNQYMEMVRTAWANRDQLSYAWRILRDGCCDGCSLGTMGMKDWTLPGIHLCSVRLNMMRLNTAPALDISLLGDVEDLEAMDSRQLRSLGRLPYPMVRHRGERGFQRVSWDEALDLAAGAVRAAPPQRLAFYLTSRGLMNEVYYAANKAARFLGTNNIDNAARICHAPSTVALQRSIGYGATTVSYTDWLGTGLLVLVGTNLANNQPVTTKYIYEAKKAGTRVAVVNPYREPGLDRYWVPSAVESALFGTRIMDEFFQIAHGGDVAFFNGALKHLLEEAEGKLDRDFIEGRTAGFDTLAESLRSQSWTDLERLAGVDRRTMARFAELYADAGSSVTVWSMGITQHEYGTRNVHAMVNLALALGRIGKPRSGLMPIRGHSGVQGGAEMGAVPNAYAMGRPVDARQAEAMEELWGFPVPTTPGMTATQMVEEAHAGRVDVMYLMGGNFLETLPEPDYVADALRRVPVRIHQDIVLSPQMLLDPGEAVLILPGATRYESPGGLTQTNTERRVIFSPEIPGRRVGEARPEWEIILDVARRADPERAHLLDHPDPASLREDIARTVPLYEPIRSLQKKGDQFQWGGPMLCADGRFPTADGKARFVAVLPPDLDGPPGHFFMSTRRGKQFNSMVWGSRDGLTGAGRDHVFISAEDAGRLGLQAGDPVVLRSDVGELTGRVHLADIRPGHIQVHWPEGNCLIRRGVVDPESGEPHYNAWVTVEKAGG